MKTVRTPSGKPGWEKITPWPKDPKQRTYYTQGVYSLGVYSLGLPISDLDLYLLALGVYTLGVDTLGVYSLGQRISDLELPELHTCYMLVLKQR